MKCSELLQKYLSRTLLVGIMIICTGCVSMLRIDGPYEGKVVDAETQKPLEGVVVHGDWYKVWGTVAGASSEWYDSAETRTDTNGEFRIPGKGLLVLSSIDKITLTIFKAGYEQITPSTWNGIKQWKSEQVYWEGNNPNFRIRRLTMEERRKTGVVHPNVPNKKQKLLIIESNKEMIETGRPSNTLMPLE